ncbi:hypothetical protein A4G28_13645 [Mycobacterium ostraviense]|uniref:Uncharacterized protein n=1 Tax=Mycobacterium ostraviense TaxID=2738409 RepID=A0A163WIU1_9MYCO|nr:hypothetical protein A4G28_13645 [Mycobacterium ostraviense]
MLLCSKPSEVVGPPAGAGPSPASPTAVCVKSVGGGPGSSPAVTWRTGSETNIEPLLPQLLVSERPRQADGIQQNARNVGSLV